MSIDKSAKETCQLLELVETAKLTVVSSTGCTLWTRGNVALPELQDCDFLMSEPNQISLMF